MKDNFRKIIHNAEPIIMNEPLAEILGAFEKDSIIEYLFRKGWSRNLRSKKEKEHGVDVKVRNIISYT